MRHLSLLIGLLSVSAFSWAEFSCPDGTEAACIEAADRVCSANTKCVDTTAACFGEFPCGADEGFVCGSEYDAALHDHQRSMEKYDKLVKENVDLRQERLDRKNCVLNATGLIEAQKCVR